ncbi:MAG: TetR/AcrR family transcriptional regulator [Clostridiales bacterium]|nr:TetR/AcrR family transcriptional regulator [Clostridiales bacterium]
MAIRFTEKERNEIIKALREAAGRRAATVGMRKTTVDELALEAGISKGAFYLFYPSKEHLFVDVLEQWYQSILDKANAALHDGAALPPAQRTARMFKAAWRAMREQQMIRFCQTELPLLIRKLPETVMRERFQSAQDFIVGLVERAGVRFSIPKEQVTAAFMILFFSTLTATEVGFYFDNALDVLIDGACREMIRDE